MEVALPEEPGVLRDDIGVPVADVCEQVHRHGVRREHDQPVRVLVQEHLPLRRSRGHHTDRGRHAPEVVEKHRNRLPDRREPVLRGAELERDVGEVLRVEPEVQVEIRDEGSGGVEPELVALGLEHRAAVGHRRGLAHDDAGQQRVLDVDERPKRSGELLAEAGHVLDAAGVGLAGDDRADAEVLRVALRREGGDGRVEHLEGLGVRRDEGALDHLGRRRRSGRQGRLELLASLPPIDAFVRSKRAHRLPHASNRDRGPEQPVGVEEHRAQTQDPEHRRIVDPDREGGDHRREQDRPRERTGKDFQKPLLGMVRQRDR